MLMITLRDIQSRTRRIVLGLMATALVFAMTLLLGAVHDSFLAETQRTVDFFGGDVWVVPDGISGPFTTNSPLQEALADRVASEPGVSAVTPVALFRHVVRGNDTDFMDVNVIGYEPGGVVVPKPYEGREPQRLGEAVADETLGVAVGEELRLADTDLKVVGLVRGLTYNGGTAGLLMTLGQAQAIAFDGRPLASALVVAGTPESTPDGYIAMDRDAVRADLTRPLSVATDTLGLLAVLLWIVAAGIVGFVCYLSGLDRLRDFAVFKAVGVRTRTLSASLLMQSVLVSLAAATVAIVLAAAFVPLFPLPVSLSAGPCLQLIGVALIIGLVASIASIRNTMTVDPALAFAG